MLAPVFFFLPTDVDGGWERGLALVVIAWVVVLARFVAGRRRRIALT